MYGLIKSLTFKIQVIKANKTLGLIQRSYTYLDKTSLTKLYIALVTCTLEYEYLVWFLIYRKDCELLEHVQRRATKVESSLKELPY